MKINNLTSIILATGLTLSSGVHAQSKLPQLGDIMHNNANLVHATLCANTIVCNPTSTIPVLTYDSIGHLSLLGNRVQQISDYELLKSVRTPVNNILFGLGVSVNEIGQIGPKGSSWSFRGSINHDGSHITGGELNATYQF